MRTSLALSAFLLALLFALWLGTRNPPPGVVYKGTWCCESTASAAGLDSAPQITGKGCTTAIADCKSGKQPVKLDCVGNTSDDGKGNIQCF
jgi:hypothetical protein